MTTVLFGCEFFSHSREPEIELPSSVKPIEFAVKTIKVGDHSLKVWIADTPEKRDRGLMYRKSFGALDGMLFIFPDEDYRAFWMKNTFMPLSIGYFDAQGKLFDIQDMTPLGLSGGPTISYPSQGRARYALELKQGDFEKRKIKRGDILKLP